jgi:hypothetical protein
MKILEESPDASFFHTPIWARILSEVYGYHIATRLFETIEGEVLFPMLEMQRYGFRALSSMPLGYGGFFPSDISGENFQAIVESLLRGRILRLYLSLPPNSRMTVPQMGCAEERVTDWDCAQILDLRGGSEAVTERIGRYLRRDIRRAERRGVEIESSDSLNEYRELYEIYAARSREWGYSEPPLPFRLFEAVYRLARPYAHLNLAKVNGETIGGELSFVYGNTPFGWILAVDRTYASLHPGPLLLYRTILDMCERGYSSLNMGSSGRLGNVRDYKTRWGAMEVPVPHFVYRRRFDRLIHPFGTMVRSAFEIQAPVSNQDETLEDASRIRGT